MGPQIPTPQHRVIDELLQQGALFSPVYRAPVCIQTTARYPTSTELAQTTGPTVAPVRPYFTEQTPSRGLDYSPISTTLQWDMWRS